MIACWRVVIAVGLLLLGTGCGRKGALIYPDMLVPAAPSAVTAHQRGAAVKLQLSLPDKDRAGRPVNGIAGVKISKRTAAAGQKSFCRSCLTDFRLIQTLYLDHLPPATQRSGNSLTVIDSDVSAGNSYSYSIVPFTVDGIDGAPSAAVDVQVVPQFPPPGLKIESHPTEVKLFFSYPPLITGTVSGYNLYRSPRGETVSYYPVTREPLQGNEYADTVLKRGVMYRYSARAVIMLPSGNIAESAESNEVEGGLTDDE